MCGRAGAFFVRLLFLIFGLSIRMLLGKRREGAGRGCNTLYLPKGNDKRLPKQKKQTEAEPIDSTVATRESDDEEALRKPGRERSNPRYKAKTNVCWRSKPVSVQWTDYSKCCSQESRHEQPQHQMCARITGSTSLSIRDKVQQIGGNHLSAVNSQIHIVSSDPNVSPTHVRFIQPASRPDSRPGVPSVAVAIADTGQSMCSFKFSNTAEPNQIFKKMTACQRIQCRRERNTSSE